MKVKKSILTICLALMLLLSSFVLFACGNDQTSASAYKAYNELFTEMKQNVSLFSTGTTGGLSTSFYLNNFCYKDSGNNKVFEYNHYLMLNAASLEFIDEYYPVLENLKLKTDYSTLKSDVKSLRKSYKTLKSEYDRYLVNAVNVNTVAYTIYNGYFSRYRTYARKFIAETYDCALSLGKFLETKVKLSKTFATDEMTEEATEFYLDYNILKVMDDFKDFFMNSCKGLKLEGEEYKLTIKNLETWTGEIVGKTYKTISNEQANNFKDISVRLGVERKMTDKALSRFSFYKYENTYSSSLAAYKKSNAYAPAYYNRLNSYFWKTDNGRDCSIDILAIYLIEDAIA